MSTEELRDSYTEPISPVVNDIEDLAPEVQEALAKIAEMGDDDDDDDEWESTPDEEPEPHEEVVQPRTPQREVDPEGEPEEKAVEEESDKESKDDIDERFSAGLTKLREREESLKAKEAEIAPQLERLGRYEDTLKTFADDPVEAMRTLVRDAIGTDDSDAIEKAVGELYNAMTLSVLEVPLDSNESKAAKLERQFEAYKRAQAAKEKKLEQEREALAHEREIQQAVTTIRNTFEPIKEQYPFLSMQKAPEEVIWGYVVTKYNDGEELSFEEAAKACDDHIRKELEPYRHLFANGASHEEQEATPQAKRARAMTNAAASNATTPAKKRRREYIEDPEKSKRAALELLPQLDEDDDDW